MAIKPIIIFFTFFVLTALHPTSFAQQLSVGLNELAQGADVIIIGKVTQQTSIWNEDQTRIYTRATIQVDEYIKGNAAGNTVTVKYLGGEVGDVGEMYSHMPRFDNDEDVLVFLKKDDSSNDYKVFNGEDGKISVIIDQKTGEKLTTSNLKINSIKAKIKSHLND